MLIWILLVLVVAMTIKIAEHFIRSRRRVRRRHGRRERHKLYQRLWDQVMVRPRIKRITTRPTNVTIEAVDVDMH